MNEAETRAGQIDPALKAARWGLVEGSRVRREYLIAPGRIEGHGRRGNPFLKYGERAWNRTGKGECWGLMGNSQGRDNVKKRAARRKKMERLAVAKNNAAKKAAK